MIVATPMSVRFDARSLRSSFAKTTLLTNWMAASALRRLWGANASAKKLDRLPPCEGGAGGRNGWASAWARACGGKG